MIDGRKVLAVIVARGGSKGLPDKALKDLGGKPVVAWSVAAALGSKLVDRTIISTDDARIIAAARAAGCDAPFTRPAALATDDASVAAVMLHALGALDEQYDYAVLLQASSPLRIAEDIDGCISACHRASARAAVTVTNTTKPMRWMFELEGNGRFRPLISDQLWNDLQRRRQVFPETYNPNGAVYVTRVDSFMATQSFYFPDTIGWPVPPDRSIDIDIRIDLELARLLIRGSDKS